MLFFALAHHPTVGAIVGAVPAAIMLPVGGAHPAFYLNTAVRAVRAHVVLLIVAAGSTVRHVTELAQSIHAALG